MCCDGEGVWCVVMVRDVWCIVMVRMCGVL